MAAALPPQPSPSAIVITGKALPNSRAEKVYDVQPISGRQIAQSPSHELDQLLKDIPGLQLFRRSDARSGHPTSQGVTLRALGGNASSRALLVLDGVPQTDPFGGWINWPAYDPSDLSEIRVIRGGGSVANGPGALAGTIEMTSRADLGETGELDAGSRDSLETRARLGFSAGSGVIILSGRGERSDGFIPITASTRGPADIPAPYHEWSGRGRWIAPIGTSTELQASIDGFHDWRTRGTDFSSDRTNGSDASLRLVGHGDWQWSALGYWQWRNLRSSTASVSDARLSASRVLLQDSVPSRGVGGSFELRPPMPAGVELRLGADTRRTTGATHELANFVNEEPTKRRVAGGETWTAGAFAEASADIVSLTLTGGARIDHWRVGDGHLFERQIATGALTRDEQFPERQGWLPTARGGILKRLGGGFSLRSAAYLGWRMPTLNELFRPFRAGSDATAANPELKPERLAGVEAGAAFASGPVSISLTAFLNRLNDAIANVTLGEGPGIFPDVGFVGAGGVFRQRQNVDAVNVRGLEASAQWSSGPWAVRAGASLTHARMEGNGAAEFLNGLRPAETPNFAGTLSGSWQQGGRGAEIVLRRIGGQYDDDLNLDLLKPATTLDAYASWPLGGRFQLVARAENLTNTLVEAGINGDGSIERATPRTLWIGVRLNGGH
ncbi:MAG TPA: TonB-dependent receptor [Sphingomicrobium sp.]|nr:TonB-dependent receptor [Sphingomicrobium sp.]